LTRQVQTSRLELESTAPSVELFESRIFTSAENQHFRSAAEELCDALLSTDLTICDQLVMSLITGGVLPNDLIDHVIPAAARQLGDDWLLDSRSFADVTIGTSRLQQIVRNLETSRTRENLVNIVERRALLIVPKSEQHTLGSVIVANQLRRHGVRVEVAFDTRVENLRSNIDVQKFFMVGVSLGTDKSVERVGSIITDLRNFGVNAPIALGGRALSGSQEDIVSAIGADFFAKNAREALDLCDKCVSREALLT